MGARHLEIVSRDPREPGVAGLAQRDDLLERGRPAVELLERGHGMGLIEVEHIGVEETPGVVELVLHAFGIGPQRLARDEDLVA